MRTAGCYVRRWVLCETLTAMGILASVFGAGSDEEAGAALSGSDGLVCDIDPTELWELEGILTSTPALEVPAAQYQPVAATDDYESFVIAVSTGLGGALDAAGETGRAAAARQWEDASSELEGWSPEQVHRLVEDLSSTLASIAAAGQRPYLRVSV